MPLAASILCIAEEVDSCVSACVGDKCTGGLGCCGSIKLDSLVEGAAINKQTNKN